MHREISKIVFDNSDKSPKELAKMIVDFIKQQSPDLIPQLSWIIINLEKYEQIPDDYYRELIQEIIFLYDETFTCYSKKFVVQFIIEKDSEDNITFFFIDNKPINSIEDIIKKNIEITDNGWIIKVFDKKEFEEEVKNTPYCLSDVIKISEQTFNMLLAGAFEKYKIEKGIE